MVTSIGQGAISGTAGSKRKKRAGAKKKKTSKLSLMNVESLRWREVEWRRISPPMHLHTMHYLTAHDTVNLDTAVAEKEEPRLE